MSIESDAYAKHKNLKLAANEIGMVWQTLYVNLKKQGVAVIGDKLRYGSDRDKLAAMAEAEFLRLVPQADNINARRFQHKWDFDVGQLKVDVKAGMKRKMNKKYESLSWSFSFKKQSLICDFICCFCMADRHTIERILLVPKEFFAGLQTVSVSCVGYSKWHDYSIEANDLAAFFTAID